jgi:hypothetical protein
MLSDSCHSGTVAKMVQYDQFTKQGPLAEQYAAALAYRTVQGPTSASPFRLMPFDINTEAYKSNASLYDSVQWLSGRGDKSTIGASILLISGCLDNQLSLDGARNGLFTQTLLGVWNNGNFRGNYEGFHRAILQQMPATQSPNLYKVGAPNAAFEAERPFTIASVAAATSRPTIQPVTPTISAGGPPPRFSVNPGQDRYFAVEVATRPDLFNLAANGSQRTENNFFGSWRTKPFPRASSYPTEFELPADAWNRLRAANGPLYYRAWGSDSGTAWVNSLSSVPDGQAATAPSIQLTAAAATSPAAPQIRPNATTIPNGPTPPRFIIDPGAGRYYAVEVATRADLFNFAANGSQRNDANFFGSWASKPYPTSASYPVSYDLPPAVWERLRQNAGQLFYRIWATDSPTAWVNAVSSVRDSQAGGAPSIQLTARQMEGVPVF